MRVNSNEKKRKNSQNELFIHFICFGLFGCLCLCVERANRETNYFSLFVRFMSGWSLKFAKMCKLKCFVDLVFICHLSKSKQTEQKTNAFHLRFCWIFQRFQLTDDKINCVAITANFTGDLFQFWLQTRRNEKKNFILAIETWTAHESENDECFLTPSLNFN